MKQYWNQKNYEEPCDELELLEIRLLLEGIYIHYGYDFRDYNLSSIRRRVWNRIWAEKLNSISGLQEKVLHDVLCMARLFADFSIIVTEMFRDASFFKTFRSKVVPLLRDCASLRIWHAGCATGEEVYSMAILLEEEGLYERTRIYATDMNADALERAKQGIVKLNKMQNYTRNYLQAGGSKAFAEYYTAKHDHVVFNPALIKNVVFGQHNLAVDGSFNEFHVILCRNVLIYFNRNLQSRVLGLFKESLIAKGILGLGIREGVEYTHYGKCYEELDVGSRIYRKN